MREHGDPIHEHDAPARKPPLRIGLLTHSVNPRGGVVHTLELARALHAAGHTVTVIAPALPGQTLFRTMPCPVELAIIDAGASERGHPTPLAAMVATRVQALLRHFAAEPAARAPGRRFDVLHAQDGIGGNALATLCERGFISGFMRTVHHVDHFDDATVDAWSARAVRGADRVLCVSQATRLAVERRYGIAAQVVPNGVDTTRYSPRAEARDLEVARRWGLSPGAPLVLSVGGIEARKNSTRLFEAFVRLARHSPGAQLGIVGGASLLEHGPALDEFRAALAASGLGVGRDRAVVLTGSVPDADMPALFRLADAVAYPSLQEGFGLVVLEALATGKPVVTSRRAPFTEYLGETDVHWADPLDVTSIEAALVAALAAPKFTPPSVCARFSWPASATLHVAHYRDLVADRRRTADRRACH